MLYFKQHGVQGIQHPIKTWQSGRGHGGHGHGGHGHGGHGHGGHGHPTPGYDGQLDMDIVVPGNRQLQWSIIGSDMPSALDLVNVYTCF